MTKFFCKEKAPYGFLVGRSSAVLLMYCIIECHLWSLLITKRRILNYILRSIPPIRGSCQVQHNPKYAEVGWEKRVRKDLSQLLVSLLTIKIWGSIKEGCGCLCLSQKAASSFWWILPGSAKDGAAVAYREKLLQPECISTVQMSEIHPASRPWAWRWGWSYLSWSAQVHACLDLPGHQLPFCRKCLCSIYWKRTLIHWYC